MAKPRKGSVRHPSGLVVREASLSRAQPLKWIWQRRLLIGYINLMVGEEGIGKSTVAAWIMAQITKGKLKGDLHGKPANVAVIGDEDDFDNIWTPRLHAAGADLRGRVKFIESGPSGVLDLRHDYKALSAFIKEEEIALVYFDQLLDNIGATNNWKDKEVRDALAPLRGVVRETNTSALTTLHPNKRGGSFRDRVSGTPAFNALSRSSLYVGPHPYDGSRRALVRGKGNYSQEPKSFEFGIAERKFVIGKNHRKRTLTTSRVDDPAFGQLTADDVIDGYERGGPGSESKAAVAKRELARLFAGGKKREPGPVQEKLEADHGISKRTSANAARAIGLVSSKSGFPAQTFWSFPASDGGEE